MYIWFDRLTMPRPIFVFIFGVSFSALNAQLPFMELTTDIPIELNDVEFVNVEVGYTIGKNGKIYKTLDGGFNWNLQASTVAVELFDVEFFDEQIGWACGKGVVVRTTNGGTSWTSTTILPADEFYTIDFSNASQGYVAGKNTSTGQAEIYYTTDGGNSFTGIAPPNAISTISDMVFFDLFNGYVLSGDALHYTTNQGVSWTPVALPLPAGVLLTRIEMTDAQHGWMVGQNGTVLVTTSGTSWNAQVSGTASNLTGLSMIDANTFFACGDDGTVISTTNGGANWTTHTTPITAVLNSIDAVDINNAWSCGELGKMIRTHVDTDLEIQGYAGDLYLCPDQLFDVLVNVKNGGLAPIESGHFQVLKNGATVIEFDWAGTLAQGVADQIYVGQTFIEENSTLTINFTGDDLGANNAVNDYVYLHNVNPYGVNGPLEICPGESIELIATGGKTYHWLNATLDSTAHTQVVNPVSTTDYFVEIVQENCTFTDTATVVVNPGNCTTNAFSPNGDGTNDFLYLDNLPTDNVVSIFNRWGDVLITIENYNNNTIFWNGDDLTGNNLLEGVYFYTVESKASGAHSRGWIQLLR